MSDLWQATLSDLATKVSAHNFDSWFKNIEFNHQEAQVVHLEVSDEFFKAWIEDNYLDLIVESLRICAGVALDVKIHVQGTLPPQADQVRSIDLPQSPVAARQATLPAAKAAPAPKPINAQTNFFDVLRPEPPTQPFTPEMLQQRIMDAGLNPRYTFEEFVVGPSNQFTNAACYSVSQNPGKNYNPLFIFGGVGLGKTHLLHAVGIEILRNNPNMRVISLSSEAFMNRLIASLRSRDMDNFRAQFRENCDVLLIDDIQFIGGKDSTQEEFFHTFNALYQSGKQIVITSDKPPKELPGIEERLRSRFSWGLSADIQPPSIETRIAILETKAENDGIPLTHDVALLLASHISSNVRELEGILVRLGAEASFSNTAITLDMARQHLRRMNIEQQQELNIERIIRTVADHFNITHADIIGPRRTRAISEPRQYAMYLSRKLTDHSYPEIGSQFGGKDHTTVMAACRKIEKLLPRDTALEDMLQHLERQLTRTI